MYKFSSILAMVILAAAPLTAVGAVEPLDVKLRNPDSQQKAESGIILVSVTNRSNRALLLPKGDSALLTDDGHLLNNVMKVVSADDLPVAYQGRASRVATRDRDERFWTISPGQTMTSEVNLPLNYAIEGGTYSVSYDQSYIELGAWDPDGATYEIAHSNVLSIYANSSLIDGQREMRGKVSLLDTEPAGPDQTCTDPAQVTTINNARSIASSWSFYGESDLGHLYDVKYYQDASAKIVWKAYLEPDTTYTTWFGALQDTSPVFDSPPAREDVWNSGDFLPLHVSAAIWSRVDNVDHYSCGCSAAEDAAGSAAWTEESRTHLCSSFFSQPFSTYGVDSQVVIIIHENAHHADGYGPYVGDIPKAYGRAAAKALALSNRANAIMNADNYAYYAEAERMKKDSFSANPGFTKKVPDAAPSLFKTEEKSGP